MDFSEFILKIHEYDWGIAAFNTYNQNRINHCYMMVSEKGTNVKAIKIECSAYNLNEKLDQVLLEIQNRSK